MGVSAQARMDRLNEIYACLPKLECKRLCQESCGPVLWTEVENVNIGETVGGRFREAKPHWLEIFGGNLDSLTCPYLEVGSCSIYTVRPLICRLWGLVNVAGMRCPFGCEPERWLTNEEAKALLREVSKL